MRLPNLPEATLRSSAGWSWPGSCCFQSGAYRSATALLAVSLMVFGDMPLAAASPSIGIVAANGSFRMNNITVRGNATLLEGATVETAGVPSQVELTSGARFTLGADSRGQIFGDHMVLERGQGDMAKTLGLRLQARGLTIQPETSESTGRVQLAGVNKIQVAVSKGSFRVLNSNGLLVAKLVPGTALAFEPQGTATMTRIAGRLTLKAGHLVMTDEITHVTAEVVGHDLEKMAGKRIAVTGSLDQAAAPVSDASQLVRVRSYSLLAQAGAAPAGSTAGGSGGAGSAAGGSAAGGGAAGGGAAGGGAAAGGAAAGGAAAGATALGVGLTTITIVGGVAAAAVVGGLAASGAIGGGSDASLSR